MGASASDGAGHTSIVANMVFAPRPPVDDIDREPMPPDRPSARAQWDEAHGVWVEWHEDDFDWEPVEGASEDSRRDPADEPG